jgi:hypothetical protein
VRQIWAIKYLREGAGDQVALKRNGHFQHYPHLILCLKPISRDNEQGSLNRVLADGKNC